MDKRCRDIIALTFVPGLGVRKIIAMLKAVSDTEEIFSASSLQLSEMIGRRFTDVNKLKTIRSSEEYIAELKYIEAESIVPVFYGTSAYPRLLEKIYDPSPVLYCKGELVSEDINSVAIVGSRKCSLYGLQMAEKLAFDLAERGITVISGMARGIDTAAHRGALKAGGRTIAVTGSGFKHVYPPEAKGLMGSIAASGAVVTEYVSNIFPLKANFPRRNRIVSGMAKGVVVVEAAKKSGAMITVNTALEQGREVFAVPGRADLYTAGGTNALIQNGAKLVTDVNDILEELQLEEQIDFNRSAKDATEAISCVKEKHDLDSECRKIFEILQRENSVHVDELPERVKVERKKLPELLLRMEVSGYVKAVAGGRYAIKAS